MIFPLAKAKNSFLFLVIVGLTIGLTYANRNLDNYLIFHKLTAAINKQIVYQSITLLSTIAFLFLLWWTKREVFQEYFQKGNISAKIKPEPLMGIKPRPHENWFHFGRSFAIVISIVTAVIIYFQIVQKSTISIESILWIMPFSVVFALSNSFVEECITRLGVIVVLKHSFGDKNIAIISAAVFGIAHYWGNPGGPIGVLAAGFLGWLLAKSILETKGLFWAWFIHFLQDVIIFSALLST